MAQLPDLGTLKSAIALALRAPSMHNTQPWRWRLGDETIHLHANPSLAVPQADPDGRELALSCGTALHHVRVALAALGWAAHVHRLPNPADPLHIAAIEFSRHLPTGQDLELAAAIPRRRTDRRHYGAWPVPMGSIARVAARAAQEGVLLTRVELSDSLAQAVSAAAEAHFEDSNYASELALWSGMHAGVDGVPARSAPVVHGTDPLPARRFAHPQLTQPVGISAVEDAEEIVVLSTSSDDLLSRIRAGEATSAALLTATTLGLSSCPITEPLEISETRESVRTSVLDGAGWPQMILRLGWPALNADPLPATPRRRIEDFLFDLTGAPLGQLA